MAGASVVATVSELGVPNRAPDAMPSGFDARGDVLGRMSYSAHRRNTGGRAPDSVPLLMADRASERIDTIARSFGGRLDCEPSLLSGWPEWVPPFRPDFRVPVPMGAPDGSVVIARTPTADLPGNRYDVVNREGRRVGTISLPTNERLIGFGERSVYTALTERVDLQTLRRHPWP